MLLSFAGPQSTNFIVGFRWVGVTRVDEFLNIVLKLAHYLKLKLTLLRYFSDTGNSDIPRATPSTSDYDIPATTFTSVDGNYDVPRSSEYVHNENADENSGKERDVLNDFAV